MTRARYLAAIVLALALAAPAVAIDVQNLHPALGAENLVSLYSSRMLAHGRFSIGYLFGYAADPFVLDFDGDIDSQKIVEALTTHEISAAVGILDWVTIGAGVSYNTVFGELLGPAFAIDGLSTDDPQDTDLDEDGHRRCARGGQGAHPGRRTRVGRPGGGNRR